MGQLISQQPLMTAIHRPSAELMFRDSRRLCLRNGTFTTSQNHGEIGKSAIDTYRANPPFTYPQKQVPNGAPDDRGYATHQRLTRKRRRKISCLTKV